MIKKIAVYIGRSPALVEAALILADKKISYKIKKRLNAKKRISKKYKNIYEKELMYKLYIVLTDIYQVNLGIDEYLNIISGEKNDSLRRNRKRNIYI